jgi:hypothetical protein
VKRAHATISALLLPFGLVGCGIAGAEKPSCDRTCIVELAGNCLEAVASHDPSVVPRTGDLHEQNSQDMRIQPLDQAVAQISKIDPEARAHESKAVAAAAQHSSPPDLDQDIG